MDMLDRYKPVVAKNLGKFFDQTSSAGEFQIDKKVDIGGQLQKLTTGGKLLRGSLVCFSYQLFTNKKPNKSVIKTAMAMELFHTALLIQDDIMDGDIERRGQTALHIQLQKLYRQKSNQRFGENLAISASDLLLMQAFRLLGETSLSKLTKLFSDQLAQTSLGQIQDIYFATQSKDISKDQIYKVMTNKTASYTITLPFLAGSILAEQSSRMYGPLRDFGESLGLIFQIRNDERGQFGSDIKTAKQTLFYFYLLQKCTSVERKKLGLIYGNPKISTKDLAYVKRLLEKYEIQKIIDREITNLQKTAEQSITRLNLPAKKSEELKKLVSYCARS